MKCVLLLYIIHHFDGVQIKSNKSQFSALCNTINSTATLQKKKKKICFGIFSEIIKKYLIHRHSQEKSKNQILFKGMFSHFFHKNEHFSFIILHRKIFPDVLQF